MLNPEAICSGDLSFARQPRRKVAAVINSRAGVAMGWDAAAISDAVRQPLEAAGYEAAVDCVAPEDLDRAIRDAADSAIDVLVVGGGDGTIRTAARHILGSNKTLGILPVGTMNRLAKDLGIPLDLPSAVSVLTHGRPTEIDVATVNDELFLCNSVMGATLRYSVGRSRLRGRPALERLPRYLSIIRGVLSSRRRLSIVVDHGEERVRIRALSVAVANNGYDETPGALRRPDLSGGTLSLYASKHRSGWGMATAVIRALLGRWDGDPEMVKLVGRELVIHSRKRRTWIANDGEVGQFATPLRYQILPRAVTVLVPR